MKKQNNSIENNLHKSIWCDGCNKEIRGRRYKCLICPDFDLCQLCEQRNEHFGHAMLRLVKPDTLLPEWLKLKDEGLIQIKNTQRKNSPAQKRRSNSTTGNTKKTTPRISQKSKISMTK